jgi:DNA repair protein RadC
LFKGGRAAAHVDPKVLMADVLEKGSDGIMIVHNHPSSNTLPSSQDCLMTERIRDVAELLNVQYIDHFLIAKGKVVPDVGGLEQVREYQQSIKPKRRIQKKDNLMVAER